MEEQLLPFNNSFVATKLKELEITKYPQILYTLQEDSGDSAGSTNKFKFELLQEALMEFYTQKENDKLSIFSRNVTNTLEVTLKCHKLIKYSTIADMKEKEKKDILNSLVEQLQKIHSYNLLVNFFDFRYLFSKYTFQYSLQSMPCMTKMDQNYFLGTEDIAPKPKNACRSQLIFKGGSIASDYLALIKNFGLAAYPESFKLIKPYKPEEELKELMNENIFLSAEHIEFWYFSEQCTDECVQIVGANGELTQRCSHQLESVLIPLQSTFVSDSLKKMCTKQLNREAEIVKQQKRVNQQRKKADILKNNLQQLVNRIYQHTNGQQIKQDLQNVQIILDTLKDLQGAENQENQNKLDEYGSELIKNIISYQQAFVP